MSDAIAAGRAHGLLACAQGRAIGWCSAARDLGSETYRELPRRLVVRKPLRR